LGGVGQEGKRERGKDGRKEGKKEEETREVWKGRERGVKK
jgi:hypothetical protein